MGRVIISHLGPAQETEIRFLLDLAEAFRAQGRQPIIWSAIYDRRIAPYYLPLNWRLKELSKYYADLSPRDAPSLDLDKWRARVEVLIKQDCADSEREELLQQLVSMSLQVVDAFKPDLLLAWNTLCPHTGIACDLNRAAGRGGWLIEKAVFPHTWFIESGGLVGHSTLANQSLESLVPAEEMPRYAETGRAYLEQTNFGAYNRYAQADRCEVFERATSGENSERLPRIAFFPPDDGTLGFVPVDHDDRKATVPHYANSFEAAKALSLAHGGITIYKVHPSLAQHPHDTTGYPNLHVVNYDFRKVIEWADIVATTGSGLEFIAMAMGKPVLLLGNDILAGKGIAYEGQAPDELPGAITAAQAREGFEERIQRFHAYCGWLVANELVSTTDAAAPCKTPSLAAEEIVFGCLAAASAPVGVFSAVEVELWLRTGVDAFTWHPEEAEAAFWAARAALLTPAWRDKLAKDTEEQVDLRDKPKTSLITEAPELLAAVEGCTDDLVLDFDNTLILQNSTERWLDTLRPKTLAFLVCLVCDFVVGFAARRKWCKADRWRDQLRVAATSVLFPWNLVWWRLSAKRRMGRYLNNALADAVAKSKPREITIITFGFEHVVAPLVAHLPFKAKLIASKAFSTRDNLRKRGKVSALVDALGSDRVKTCLFITDSRDDQEVIDHAGRAALHQWANYPSPAFARTYFPMRYAVQGKYAGRNYFKTQILQEDLALWLLAYEWSLATLPSLLLFFLALYCVYEVGYWRNDHVAAKKEAKPTLSASHARFTNYPIWQAYVWAAIASLCAIELNMVTQGQHFFHHWPEMGGTWVATLVALVIAFRVFNYLPTSKRTLVFPVLHFIKNFAPVLFIPLSPLGGTLLASQVASQIMVYAIHRSGGNTASFNRQGQRFILFFVIAFALGMVGIRYSMTTESGMVYVNAVNDGSLPSWATVRPWWHYQALQLTLILLWMTFRIVQRAYGRGLIGIMRKAVGR